MNVSPSRQRVHTGRLPIALAAGLLGLLGSARGASAATWGDWWLPPDYSKHGPAMDWLFNVIFWITMVIFVGVQALLVYFSIKYRFRPDKRKGIFSHGNTRVEMIWTIVPAIILIWISLATKRVWDEYRFGPQDGAPKTQVLVVGEQFKWNVVYPGPDGKLGTYLSYPKTTDPKYNFKPREQAVKDIETELRDNPLGQAVDKKNPNDPGKDDDYTRAAGRPMIIPVDRPLEVVLSAKDVLHSFFLPNFRVKLDAVPGLRGLIYFTAVQHSMAEAAVDAVPADKAVWLDQAVPGAVLHGNPKTFKIFDPASKKPLASRPIWLQSVESLNEAARKRLTRAIMAEKKIGAAEASELVTPPLLADEVGRLRADLKSLGVERLAYVERQFEIVCEELCGFGHYTMRGDMIVVTEQQYDDFLNREALAKQTKPAARPQPATAPSAATANAR